MEIVRISKYRINRSSYENQGQVKDIKNVTGKKKNVSGVLALS